MPVLKSAVSKSKEPLAELAPDSLVAILRRAVDREAPGARTVGSAKESEGGRGSSRRSGFFETCSNPQCRTGWMQLWRSRGTPVFEGGWTCSPECTEERVRAAVRRERKGMAEPRAPHRHRIPLGLLMLEKGWITSGQLRGAVTSQKQHGGRLGGWLVRQHGISEELVTRAVALQWSCPVLKTGGRTGVQATSTLSALVPRLFVDAFGALPVRLAGGKVLYLGFEDRLDPALALAVEKMADIRVECGVVSDAEFASGHARALRAHYPSVELIEAVNEDALSHSLTRVVERAKPAWAKLVRVHDFLWLRMARKAGVDALSEPELVEDVIATIGG